MKEARNSWNGEFAGFMCLVRERIWTLDLLIRRKMLWGKFVLKVLYSRYKKKGLKPMKKYGKIETCKPWGGFLGWILERGWSLWLHSKWFICFSCFC